VATNKKFVVKNGLVAPNAESVLVGNTSLDSLLDTTYSNAVIYSDTTKVAKSSNTGSAEIPAGTQGERDGTPSAGYFRFNTDSSQFEGYDGTSWGEIGGGAGATGGGDDEVFIQNDQIVTADYTIPADKNALTTGPIEIDSNVTVTVSSGSRWVVL